MTPARPGTAAVRRMTARLAGLLVVLTAPAWLSAAVDQQDLLAPWWNLLALVAVGGPLVWLVVVSWRIGDVRVPSAVLAAGVAVCLVLWPWGVTDVAGAADGLPWLWLILPLTLTALATLGSVPLSLVYGAGVGVVYGLIRVRPVGGDGDLPVAVLEGFLLCTLSVGPAVLVVGSLRAAARLDAIADDAARASAAASRAAAAVETRRELDAVVHDTVLAALHTAVRDPQAPELPQLAQRALDTLSTSRSPRRTARGPSRRSRSAAACRRRWPPWPRTPTSTCATGRTCPPTSRAPSSTPRSRRPATPAGTAAARARCPTSG